MPHVRSDTHTHAALNTAGTTCMFRHAHKHTFSHGLLKEEENRSLDAHTCTHTHTQMKTATQLMLTLNYEY